MNHPWIVLFGLIAICVTLVAVFEPPLYHDFGRTCCSRVRSDICVIHDALDEYAAAHQGRYPESLSALVTPDDQGHRYLNQTRLPRDPWGREYVYLPGNPPNVITYGRDGVMGGTGEDADVDCRSLAGTRHGCAWHVLIR